MTYVDQDTVALSLVSREIQHYRDRWRGSERIAEARTAVILTSVGAAIAVSSGVLAANTDTLHGVSVDRLLGAIWLLTATISEGLHFRLLRARRSIISSITNINTLRQVELDALTRNDAVTIALRSVYDRDSTPPKLLRIDSSAAAAALTGSVVLFVALWLIQSGFRYPPPVYAYLTAPTLFFVDFCAALWINSRDKRTKPAGIVTTARVTSVP